MLFDSGCIGGLEYMGFWTACIKSRHPRHGHCFPATSKYAAIRLNDFHIIQLIIRKFGQFFK
ncbi:hypothetical protein D8Y20_12780 [Mariprofundus sp. EBB-1]|nr:hypothetical protein D8Y20_12780 [Mariprofundus sp. EBB-1]